MKKIILGSAMATAIAIGAVAMMFAFSSTDITNLNPEINDAIERAIRQWEPMADASPGAGACGVLNIFIFPHDATPAVTYGSNITEGGSYAYGHINSTLTGYVPYDTTFDIVVKYRFNRTVAQCSTNNSWMMSWVNSTIYSVNQGITPTTTMAEANITVAGQYLWVNFYVNNGGAGYTITHGQEVNVTAYVPYAYW